eukprot:jgi/Mesvir1/12656/Mv26078-RA.1
MSNEQRSFSFYLMLNATLQSTMKKMRTSNRPETARNRQKPDFDNHYLMV